MIYKNLFSFIGGGILSILLLLGQITILLVIIAFTIVTWTYYLLRTQVNSRKPKCTYTYLVIAWSFFTITYILLFFRKPLSITHRELHILIYKAEVVVTGVNIGWLYMFLSEVYASRIQKYAMIVVGWGICILSSIFFFQSSMSKFGLNPTDFGTEVIPPYSARILIAIGLTAIVVAFIVTVIHLRLKLLNPELQKKIQRVGLSYTIFWVFQLFEAGGAPTLFKGLGVVLTRIGLVIVAFLTIRAWAGKKMFRKALRELSPL